MHPRQILRDKGDTVNESCSCFRTWILWSLPFHSWKCIKMRKWSVNTNTCCHRTHSSHLTQTQTQTLSVHTHWGKAKAKAKVFFHVWNIFLDLFNLFFKLFRFRSVWTVPNVLTRLKCSMCDYVPVKTLPTMVGHSCRTRAPRPLYPEVKLDSLLL